MILHPEFLLQSDWLGDFLNVHGIFTSAQKILTLKRVSDYIFNLKGEFTRPKTNIAPGVRAPKGNSSSNPSVSGANC